MFIIVMNAISNNIFSCVFCFSHLIALFHLDFCANFYQGNFRGRGRGNFDRGGNSCNGKTFIRGYSFQSSSILSVSPIASLFRVRLNGAVISFHISNVI